MLNRQQPFGADVITRISATMMDEGALDTLQARAQETLAQLTEENPQGTQIPRDGKTCQPNAWPYPQGAVAPAG